MLSLNQQVIAKETSYIADDNFDKQITRQYNLPQVEGHDFASIVPTAKL